ncbi:MAG TPA: hypothetical protein VFA06_16130 [Actinocrinis sp.]|uniref:hypothetical protein n=1 Tax=Actinocrinis sp. TaxID=1920516 RepID=UPI002D24A669|nr:hypothetical protein [Actinocrinis sp.]HZU57401.1 hypothetical protein [Actinocrinis sp.]
MALTDDEMAEALAIAGLEFVERLRGEIRTPPLPGGSAAACGPEDGRFDGRLDEVVDVDDPQFASKVNAGWFRMATEYGLFDEERGFLLCVDYSDVYGEPQAEWVRVRLREDWDLVGSGVAPLGFGRFPATRGVVSTPEFAMVSLDGRTLISTTLWGNGSASTIAIRPE